MCSTLTIQQTSANYVPAELRHDTNGWYIVYYAFNPFVEKLQMKRIKLNMLRKRCRSILEFKVQVNDIMRTIDNQLRIDSTLYQQTMLATTPAAAPAVASIAVNKPVMTGGENIRYYKTLDEVMTIYINEKTKELRKSTMHSYNSFCNLMRKWLSATYPTIKAGQFTRTHAVEFLDAMAAKDLNPNTYNNMIRLGSAFFVWAKEKCYARENPFEGHKRKRTLDKKRTIITSEHQQLIDQWFGEHRPPMRIVCRLVYTSLLRPIEITRVQVKQLDFTRHCIIMPGEKTKTWEQREGRMDAELEQMLREHIRYAKPDDYIFTSGMECGPTQISDKAFCKAWVRMKKALKLPDEYQLYSLKDTAINSMLKAGVDDLSVMQAAGHKDLSMTTIYANHHDDALIENLNKKAPKFAQ